VCGIDEQVGKAEKAVAGNAPVNRNRFIQLVDGANTVNRELEAKARALASSAHLPTAPGTRSRST
jgi:hypothetical protein